MWTVELWNCGGVEGSEAFPYLSNFFRADVMAKIQQNTVYCVHLRNVVVDLD